MLSPSSSKRRPRTFGSLQARLTVSCLAVDSMTVMCPTGFLQGEAKTMFQAACSTTELGTSANDVKRPSARICSSERSRTAASSMISSSTTRSLGRVGSPAASLKRRRSFCLPTGATVDTGRVARTTPAPVRQASYAKTWSLHGLPRSARTKGNKATMYVSSSTSESHGGWNFS